jgi:hypothetical protein
MNPNVQSLVNQIQSALAPLPPSLTNQSHGSDLFEAYILTIALEAAKAEGATVTYETVQGTVPTQFVFRTSPGHIYSTRHSYTHAVIAFPDKDDLEAHVGVRVVGKSGVLHECDIAVLDRAEAQGCRLNMSEPRSPKVRIAAEAKFYSTALGLDLGRSFIGLASDLSAKHTCFVANTTSVSLTRLLAHRTDRHWYDNVTVGAQSAAQLKSYFETAFHRYKAQ